MAPYTPENTTSAYQLNWGLTLFWREQPINDARWLNRLIDATKADGVRIIKHRITTRNASQFFVSTKPPVSPAHLIRSVKGRLQNLIKGDVPRAFTRNYCVRSIGSARRSVVENYVAKQLIRNPMADSRVQARLTRFQKSYANVDLSQPSLSAHGQYTYNLHIILVHNERWMEICDEVLSAVSAAIDDTAFHNGHRLSRVALIPDHIHLTVGCRIEEAPEQVALSYLNNCALAHEGNPVYQSGYYVGTIGEYDRGAVC